MISHILTFRSALTWVLTSLLALPACFPALGQTVTPIQIVVPTPPGGNLDTTVRRIAAVLAAELGQAVVVQNRAGASTMIGTEFVAKAPADGLTVLATAPAFAINPLLFDVRYRPLKDFKPVIQLTREKNVLAINARAMTGHADLMSYATSKAPAGLNCAAPPGPLSIACAYLEQVNSIGKVLPVPYNGVATALQSLLSGDTDIMFGPIDVFIPHLQSGKLSLIESSSKLRLPSLPSSLGLVVPFNTPNDIIERYNLALNRILKSPSMQEALANSQQESVGGTAVAYGEEIIRLHEHYDAMIRTSKWKLGH